MRILKCISEVLREKICIHFGTLFKQLLDKKVKTA